MAHIIKSINISKEPVLIPQIFSCMGMRTKKTEELVQSRNLVQKQLTVAAKARQQLDADIFEREKRIQQSADAARKIKNNI